MGKIKLCFLAIILVTFALPIFSNEITDDYCGTWVAKNRFEIFASVSIYKIRDEVYYVIYNEKNAFYDSQHNKIADFYSFAEYAFTNNNKIRIYSTKYFDSEVSFTIQKNNENLYVMCNHEDFIYPYSETDYVFHRVDYKTDEELNLRKQRENNEKIKQSILDSLK